MSAAARVLDGIYSLAQLDSLEPAQVVDALAAETAEAAATAGDARAILEALEADVTATVASLDALCTRAMKLRLEHALAMDSSIGQPTRNVFASTVTSYAGRLSLLAERARDVALRGGAREPDVVADMVVRAAERVLEVRAAILEGMMLLVAQRAGALVADADRKARDRRESEAERKRASALRRELEALAEQPARIRTPLAERLAGWPEQIDEPDASAEPTWADMIELD